MRRGKSSLLRSTAAATALEFALLGPIVIGLVLVSLGFARTMLMNTLVYEAALEASRYGAACVGGSSRLSNINSISQAVAGVSATISTTPYASWTALQSGTPNTNDAAGTAGGAGEVVVYTVAYTDPLAGVLLGLIPMLAHGSTGVRTVTLTQQMVVQNEPSCSAG